MAAAYIIAHLDSYCLYIKKNMPQICITYKIPVKIKKFADCFLLRKRLLFSIWRRLSRKTFHINDRTSAQYVIK